MSNSYTPVSMLRGNSTIIDSTPIVDGQILFDETRKCLFMDNGSTREKYSGLGADSNIANVEDTTTASQPYTTGEFVVVEGQLYKVTASIATGDTFSVGTNIETDTVGSELTKINADLSELIIVDNKEISSSLNPLTGENRVFTYTIPSGYQLLSITPTVNKGNFSCTLSVITDSNITIRVTNHSTQGSAESYIVSIRIAYIKVF